MEIADVRELRQLRQGNARLKKVLAERALEVEGMKELQTKRGKPAGTATSASCRLCSWASNTPRRLALLDAPLGLGLYLTDHPA